jgi:hypothetical protein
MAHLLPNHVDYFVLPFVILTMSSTIKDGSNGDSADDHYHHYTAK